jgi:hypothetical protein
MIFKAWQSPCHSKPSRVLKQMKAQLISKSELNLLKILKVLKSMACKGKGKKK